MIIHSFLGFRLFNINKQLNQHNLKPAWESFLSDIIVPINFLKTLKKVRKNRFRFLHKTYVLASLVQKLPTVHGLYVLRDIFRCLLNREVHEVCIFQIKPVSNQNL